MDGLETEVPTLNSAEIVKMREDFDTTSFSPAGAVNVLSGSSHTHSDYNSSITNTVFADMATLRSNVYHKTHGVLTSLSSQNVAETDELRLSEFGSQTIQSPTFSFNPSYSYGASESAESEYMSYHISQCQGAKWKIIEAKVGGIDVPWVRIGEEDTFYIEPSKATGASTCCGIAHTLDLKVELQTPGKFKF